MANPDATGRFLAFDGGGTGTRAGLYNAKRGLLAEATGPQTNPVDNGIEHCVRSLVDMAVDLHPGRLDALAAGISGAGRPQFRDAIAQRLAQALDASRILITNDLAPIILANSEGGNAILVTAGTGSSIWAQRTDGTTLVIGGRGRLFGDQGSAYQIAVSALRAAAAAVDGMAAPTDLVDALPDAAGVPSFDQLVPWGAHASKEEVAALAKTVVALAEQGDGVARECLEQQAQGLARQTEAALRRLALPPRTPVYLNGGMFQHAPLYAQAYGSALRALAPGCSAQAPALTGHRAVLEVALAPGPVPEWVSICQGGNLQGGAAEPVPYSEGDVR